MNKDTRTEWDKQIQESIEISLGGLSEKIQKAEERLRDNPDFLELEQARRQYDSRNPQNLNAMGYPWGYINHLKKLKKAKVRKFSREHKPIKIFHDEWQSDPEIRYERFEMTLVEYQRLDKKPSDIYGAVQVNNINGWMRTLTLFKFKKSYGLEDLEEMVERRKREKHIMTIGPVHCYGEETKLLKYIGDYLWDNRGINDKITDALWEKLLPGGQRK